MVTDLIKAVSNVKFVPFNVISYRDWMSKSNSSPKIFLSMPRKKNKTAVRGDNDFSTSSLRGHQLLVV